VGLNPNAPRQQWRMTRLWIGLYRETYDPGVDRHIARVARRELRAALIHLPWLYHIAKDGWWQAQVLPGLGWTRHLRRPRRLVWRAP
jgi:hypothetical protein